MKNKQIKLLHIKRQIETKQTKNWDQPLFLVAMKGGVVQWEVWIWGSSEDWGRTLLKAEETIHFQRRCNGEKGRGAKTGTGPLF